MNYIVLRVKDSERVKIMVIIMAKIILNKNCSNFPVVVLVVFQNKEKKNMTCCRLPPKTVVKVTTRALTGYSMSVSW